MNYEKPTLKDKVTLKRDWANLVCHTNSIKNVLAKVKLVNEIPKIDKPMTYLKLTWRTTVNGVKGSYWSYFFTSSTFGWWTRPPGIFWYCCWPRSLSTNRAGHTQRSQNCRSLLLICPQHHTTTWTRFCTALINIIYINKSSYHICSRVLTSCCYFGK